MLRAPVTETFHPGFDGAQAIGLMRVGFEGVAHDVRAVQLHARLVRRMTEFGTVIGMVERRRHARQDGRARLGRGGGIGTHDWDLSMPQRRRQGDTDAWRTPGPTCAMNPWSS
ncbi:hypothetical protein G6F57_023063 [Rhizopus arrhizus]|nr:hypothetical protein G6F31_020759 [Rhizopus arrhizus]KAG1314176.1 hypothetical protein G6F63_016175 [Rhizopus arrhizus]KAG1430003.1 hypothetical protein G6F57_023063 [Rhizopus arrhizus]